MKSEDRFDSIIHSMIEKHFPSLLTDLTPFGWLWVKAQIWQESRMDPEAVSSAGAQGLMQLMPATDLEIDGDLDGVDVEGNIENGVMYLAKQYHCMSEIISHEERMRFALACYNGGRGYVNYALALARDAEGLPGSFRNWERSGRHAGFWQTWQYSSPFLTDCRIVIGGKSPDHKQILDYVAKIEARFRFYLYQKSEG